MVGSAASAAYLPSSMIPAAFQNSSTQKARRSGLPLDDRDYQIPFPFTGKINKLTIAVDQPKLTPEDVKKLKEAEARAADAR